MGIFTAVFEEENGDFASFGKERFNGAKCYGLVNRWNAEERWRSNLFPFDFAFFCCFFLCFASEKFFRKTGIFFLGNLCGNERKVYGRVGIVKKNLVFCGIEQGENILGNYLWNWQWSLCKIFFTKRRRKIMSFLGNFVLLWYLKKKKREWNRIFYIWKEECRII